MKIRDMRYHPEEGVLVNQRAVVSITEIDQRHPVVQAYSVKRKFHKKAPWLFAIASPNWFRLPLMYKLYLK